jgi:hypothetical protein
MRGGKGEGKIRRSGALAPVFVLLYW